MFMFDFSFFLGQFFLFISAQKMYVRYVMKMWQVKVLTVITSLTIYPATYKFDWNIFNWIPIHIFDQIRTLNITYWICNCKALYFWAIRSTNSFYVLRDNFSLIFELLQVETIA